MTSSSNNSSSSNSKGMGHVPGALCLVVGMLPRRMNGKIVTLVRKLQPGMRARCACGAVGTMTSEDLLNTGAIWQVTGTDLLCPNGSGPEAVIRQKHLIPLGDQSLLTEELLRDLADKLQDALLNTTSKVIIDPTVLSKDCN